VLLVDPESFEDPEGPLLAGIPTELLGETGMPVDGVGGARAYENVETEVDSGSAELPAEPLVLGN